MQIKYFKLPNTIQRENWCALNAIFLNICIVLHTVSFLISSYETLIWVKIRKTACKTAGSIDIEASPWWSAGGTLVFYIFLGEKNKKKFKIIGNPA